MYSIKIDWQVYQQVSEWYSWVNKYSYAFEENTMSCYIRILYFYFLLFFSRIIYFFFQFLYFLYSSLFIKISVISGFLKTTTSISFYFLLYPLHFSKLFRSIFQIKLFSFLYIIGFSISFQNKMLCII